MNSSSDPAAGGDTDSAPYLPPSRPTATGAPVVTGDVALPGSSAGSDGAAASVEAPFVPAPTPVAAPPAAEPVFDAKAMVESQKRINANPAYGAMPAASEESREATKKLRAKAQKKRRRNQRLGWFVGLLFLGGIVAAGWFAYQEYANDQDEVSVADDDDRSASEILDDLGSQGEMINAQDALNDAIVPDAGGLGNAIDDARNVVGDLNGNGEPEAASSAPAAVTVADVVPPAVVDIGERLPDLTGRETYLVDADEFAAADPAGFGRFVRLLSNQPQVPPGTLTAGGLPEPAPGQIVISVARNGDQLERALVTSATDIGINVDYRP